MNSKTAAAQTYFAGLEARLSSAASAKVGVSVTIVRWDEHAKTGAKVPVFAVPQSHADMARSLGLSVA